MSVAEIIERERHPTGAELVGNLLELGDIVDALVFGDLEHQFAEGNPSRFEPLCEGFQALLPGGRQQDHATEVEKTTPGHRAAPHFVQSPANGGKLQSRSQTLGIRGTEQGVGALQGAVTGTAGQCLESQNVAIRQRSDGLEPHL